MDSSNDTTVKNSKIKDYGQLLKPNLSFLVVFSSVIAYLLVPGVHFELSKVIILFAGGMLVTGAANAINQILEKDSDRLMKRTMFRPLPDARMQRAEAGLFAILTAFAGAALLALSFNLLTGILSLVSLLLYAFAYTPLKKISPIAVLVGAIPGAMPPLLGWVAATNRIGFEGAGTGGWILFAVQFFWQFPHFWSIAWVAYDDYAKAGIKLLPSSAGRTSFTGLQCMLYSLVLIPISMLPRLHMTGVIGMSVAIVMGIIYFYTSYLFYQHNDEKSARRVMFASFFYLPIVLIAYLLDKTVLV
ncbi:MAG: protoheme IX farnesyltransferase [Chitinophagia bacterium]|jgi:protoheme IX farnesyltransferase|nr:protoheme IX farnesyltransferase [Chitinophagia bacterium]